MGLLKSGNYIVVDEAGFITLTPSGKDVALKIYDRHTLISTFLMALGVDKQTALDDACKIEHVLSDQSFEAIKNHVKNK